ncbi:hypothetical protein [Kribbella sp. NPDC050470]|uniref:hypothetical protein n=1 Tax=unclassified Kribbella TaxID=2644121 RepID=UPI0037A6896D
MRRLGVDPGRRPDRYKTRLGATADGRESVVVSMSTQLNDSMEALFSQERTAKTLVDNAICD